jgi:hypothetical protein
MAPNESAPKPDWSVVYRPENPKAVGAIERNSEKGWERYHRPPGVRLLVELPKNGKPALVLNGEYRPEHGEGKIDIRMPGGKVFDGWLQYEDFLTKEPTEDDFITEARRTVNTEGEEEAGVHGGSLEIYHKQVAGSTVMWDRYCARVVNPELKELSPTEEERIERQHLDIDEVERLLQERDVHGEYVIKEDLSRAEIALWLLQNKYWKKNEDGVCAVCGR